MQKFDAEFTSLGFNSLKFTCARPLQANGQKKLFLGFEIDASNNNLTIMMQDFLPKKITQ
jgi:hypothetical protein